MITGWRASVLSSSMGKGMEEIQVGENKMLVKILKICKEYRKEL